MQEHAPETRSQIRELHWVRCGVNQPWCSRRWEGEDVGWVRSWLPSTVTGSRAGHPLTAIILRPWLNGWTKLVTDSNHARYPHISAIRAAAATCIVLCMIQYIVHWIARSGVSHQFYQPKRHHQHRFRGHGAGSEPPVSRFCHRKSYITGLNSIRKEE